MYAWSAALHKNGVQLTHAAPPHSPLASQPPHDAGQGAAAMLHYTWGTLYHGADGKELWRFDKRDYTAKEHELKACGGKGVQGSSPGIGSCRSGHPLLCRPHSTCFLDAPFPLLFPHTGATVQDATTPVACGLEAAGRRSRQRGVAPYNYINDIADESGLGNIAHAAAAATAAVSRGRRL